MSVDLASIRSGIAQTLSGIPEIVRVAKTTHRGESANNLPLATILRGDIQQVGLKEADTQLGGFDHLVTWTIRVHAAFRSLDDAQEFDDVIAQRLLDAFDGNLLIDPNGPGVVDLSRVTLITPFVQEEEHPALWVSEATLETFIIATL